MRMQRHDMLAEIVSNMISNIEQLAIQENRVELEAWLAPILHQHYAGAYASEPDETIAEFYEQETGTAPIGWES